MGLDSFGTLEPAKAEAQNPDPSSNSQQKQPASDAKLGARAEFSFEREAVGIQPAGYTQITMSHSPGAAAVPFGQFN